MKIPIQFSVDHTDLARRMVQDLTLDELVVFIKCLIVEYSTYYGTKQVKKLVSVLRASIH